MFFCTARWALVYTRGSRLKSISLLFMCVCVWKPVFTWPSFSKSKSPISQWPIFFLTVFLFVLSRQIRSSDKPPRKWWMYQCSLAGVMGPVIVSLHVNLMSACCWGNKVIVGQKFHLCMCVYVCMCMFVYAFFSAWFITLLLCASITVQGFCDTVKGLIQAGLFNLDTLPLLQPEAGHISWVSWLL